MAYALAVVILIALWISEELSVMRIRRRQTCVRRGYHVMGLNGNCRHCGQEML